MRICIAAVLTSLAVVLVGVLPAFASAPAAELLVTQPPVGFDRVPAEAGITGPTDVQQLGAIDGLDVPAQARSVDGYARAWTSDEAAVVGYALTFADDAGALAVHRELVTSLRAGRNAAPLPDVKDGWIATTTESAAYTSLETAVLARGNAVFVFVGSGVARSVLVDAVARQDVAVTALTPAAASGGFRVPFHAEPLAAAAAAAVVGLAVLATAVRRVRKNRPSVAPAAVWSLPPRS